ncbi:uncharacterized protein LOC121860977 [Homarus americanus]|nr:uncharacterized protein LOC121860977 [Homarus americanus]XP_042214332.1 uncharacterized protein LOC121860977 [Homarus americanus]XP_042214333.1 uncharacterized protein LOC121860977 [Homarus americanus]
MLVVVLGVALTAALVLAFVSSAFIFFIILTSKQYKSSTSLLHLQLMVTGVLLSLLFIIFSTPSFIQGRWLLHEDYTLQEVPLTPTPPHTEAPWDLYNSTDNFTVVPLAPQPPYSWVASHDPTNLTHNLSVAAFPAASLNDTTTEPDVWESDALCRLYGFLLVLLHTVAVWVVVGLHCDKYCAIATPLRYNQIVTRHRVAAFSCLAWLVSVAVASPPLVGTYSYTFSQGVCLPVWHRADATTYTWTLTTLCIILPFTILLIVNSRIIMIARHHQHRIFSAIFEVMMSAQATVTHQKNPFDIPKKKRKSVWTVLEQIVAFVVCYYPFFGTVVWESLQGRRANEYWVLLGLTFLLISPLVNSFIYGIKCKNIRKAFRNYLRKKLYKTEVKHEIQARIPSAANSRRPSISSTLAMPILHKSLPRRMSDYFLSDQTSQPKLLRRSSDMSWHPLEDGTPSPTRLRRPVDTPNVPADSSPAGSHSPASVSNFLTVPTFEAARNFYLGQQRVRLSISSLDSDISFSVKETRTEEDNLTCSPSPDIPSRGVAMSRLHDSATLQALGTPEHVSNRSKSLELPLVSCHATPSKTVTESHYESKSQVDCQTPLLCKAFEKPARSASLNSSSPHVLRTLEAILSVRISQSLLRRGSGWGGSQGSLERLSRFLRESRRSTLPEQTSYSPFTLRQTSSHERLPDNTVDRITTPESQDVSVLTFITPLANGNACMAACGKEASREATLAVP